MEPGRERFTGQWKMLTSPFHSPNKNQITLEFFPCEPAAVRLLFGKRVVPWPSFASPFPSPLRDYLKT
jgi:hypothetical protein